MLFIYFSRFFTFSHAFRKFFLFCCSYGVDYIAIGVDAVLVLFAFLIVELRYLYIYICQLVV